jgi:hypothetical protein
MSTENVVVPPGYSLGGRKWGKFYVRVTIDRGLWHLSISHPNRDLTYAELKQARYRFVPGDVTMAMLFPPEREFINFHEHCFQFWQVPGDEAPTPEQIAKVKSMNKLGETVRAAERARRRDNSDAFR